MFIVYYELHGGGNYCNFFCQADNVADDNIVVDVEPSNGGATNSSNRATATDLEDWKMNVALKIGCLEAEVRTLRMLVIRMRVMTIVAIIMCVLVCLGKQ